VTQRGLFAPTRPEGPPTEGPEATSPYTRAVRRWVCVIALLAGFAGDDYTRAARIRTPVPIERTLGQVRSRAGAAVPMEAWWSRR